MKRTELTKQDILENFDSGAHNRGFRYYENQLVVKCDIYGDINEGVLLRSEVDGAEHYTQTIELSRSNGSRHLLIESDCSCPIGYNCKHAAAVLFQMIYNGHTLRVKDNASEWLGRFMQTRLPKILDETSHKQEFLILRLFEETQDDFDFYKAKILKNGSLSKGSKISKENMFYYAHYDWKYNFLTDSDRELVTYLSNTSNNQGANTFKGEYGAFVLKKLCEAGQCYFRKNSTPLWFDAATKILRFEWKAEGEESQLVSNLKESEFLIHKTVPPLCIDNDTSRLYEVETSYSAEELSCLMEAPRFSVEAVEKVAQTILTKLPDVAFPLPDTLEVEELETKPIPHLYLYSQQNQKRTVHMMELQFLYDDHEVSSHPPRESEIIFLENRHIKVLRDSELESGMTQKLESLGFVFEPKLSAYISFTNLTMQAAIERWRDFIENWIPKLSAEGWVIETDKTFNFNFEYMECITVESSQESETNGWFELSFSVDIGGNTVSLLPIVASLLQEFDTLEELPPKLNLEIEEGRFLHIDAEEVRPILKTIFELYDKREGDVLLIKPHDAHFLEFDSQESVIWRGAKELKELSQKLKDFKGIESVPPSKNLQAQLREYQQFGLDWLYFLYTFKFSGILADDMGLGKTVQTLAFLQLLKTRGEMLKPTLIIMPTSLMGNWKNEIKKFTPDLTYLELYGLGRNEKFDQIGAYDIILTTYSLAQRDKEKYDKEQFLYIVLDEAQKIKNPKTKMSQAIKGFKSFHKLALSGTPIENHLGELWSIFDFLMPGFLESLSLFKSLYQTPIEQENDVARGELLNKKIAPFILRRTKNEVVKELPPKTEIIKKAIFGKTQAVLYENIRVSMEKRVREAVQGKGLSRSHITILDALLKLRQVCCHPELLKLESAKSVKESAKLELFLELIDELHTEGRKVLVFSQFTSMLSILEREIHKREITYTKLTGATRKREEAIAKFTHGDAEVFLISLKAGGVGLNLVEADTVIHYDPWWNPAVENQATDRAYRIGQDKAVFVYKLIVENSIEEQILQLQEKKKSLQEGIYKSKKKSEERFTGDELMALLKM